MSQTPLALLARRIRTRRRAPMLVLAALAATAAAVLTAAAPASASDSAKCRLPQVSKASHWVQYCPLWRGNVPVYSDGYHGNRAAVVGYLIQGGSSNWFVGDDDESTYTYGSYKNDWWAFTLADNGRWGWVPEVFFSGGANYEPDGGLYRCGFGLHGNYCVP